MLSALAAPPRCRVAPDSKWRRRGGREGAAAGPAPIVLARLALPPGSGRRAGGEKPSGAVGRVVPTLRASVRVADGPFPPSLVTASWSLRTPETPMMPFTSWTARICAGSAWSWSMPADRAATGMDTATVVAVSIGPSFCLVTGLLWARDWRQGEAARLCWQGRAWGDRVDGTKSPGAVRVGCQYLCKYGSRGYLVHCWEWAVCRHSVNRCSSWHQHCTQVPP